MGDEGDFGRRYVLDHPMMARVRASRFHRALDVGCGEGRFCRMLQKEGIKTVGLDPTPALLSAAKARDQKGDYVLGQAERLGFADGSFDLVVSYLSLIDMDGFEEAIQEMVRVLRPGGRLLIANLTSFSTASKWTIAPDGTRFCIIDDYLKARAEWVEWRGIRIRNWHRPMQDYMTAFLDAGLRLTYFSEPAPQGGNTEVAARYRRVPYFVITEWQKPAV